MTTFGMLRTLSLPLLLMVSITVLSGCDNSGSNGPEPTTYTADLGALNNSGVTGRATIAVEGDELTVSVDAEGTVAEQVHAQHIHGETDGMTSACPTMDADSDGNGRISVSEGAPAYGGILVPLDGSLNNAEGLGDLETFPVADANGAYNYGGSITTADLAVNGDRSFDDLSLASHAVVVHGEIVDGAFKAKLPVACGTLSLDE